jgi:hypothetical protein
LCGMLFGSYLSPNRHSFIQPHWLSFGRFLIVRMDHFAI